MDSVAREGSGRANCQGSGHPARVVIPFVASCRMEFETGVFWAMNANILLGKDLRAAAPEVEICSRPVEDDIVDVYLWDGLFGT